MPNYVPITDGLCLVQQEVKTKKTVTIRKPINHTWIYDRSASMYDSLPELIKQLIILSKKLSKGDTLTLGWFSGEGDYNFILKGFRISDDSDYALLEETLRKNSTTRNTTCFSEILEDMENVIRDLSIFSNIFSLHFFTDGHPVVSNYKREIDNIFSAIKKIKGKVHTAMFVGYGAYYNKELMSQMAEKLGALLIHSSMISEYANSITKLVKLSETQEPKEEIEPIVQNPLAVYSVTDQGVVVYSIDEDGKLYVNPEKEKSTFIYYLSTEKPNKKSWKKVTVDEINFIDTEDKIGKALYAGALVLTQQVKTDLALEVIGKVGDKNIVDSITNAFTIEEYGVVEENLNKSIGDVSLRFTNGRDPNYLPPVDAFCVLDLLKMLVKDKKAAFFPYHKDFDYERIGVANVNKNDTKFKANADTRCPFNKLVMHKNRLNLNINTTIRGTVNLKSVDGLTPASVGFAETYPTFMFRNFTIIKDGRVHTKKIYITSSNDTYCFLKNKGFVINDSFTKDGIYGIDLSKLPAINRKIANGRTSAVELCKMVYEENKLQGLIKTIKFYKGSDEEEIKKSTPFSEDQIKILEASDIKVKDGSYYPSASKGEASDKYMAKCFEIKLAGFSSLPAVNKVLDKITANKNRTPVETLIENGIDMYNGVKDTFSKKEMEQAWLESTLTDLQKQLNEVRSKIQETKFSVILGKRWFDEWNSMDNCDIEVDGMKFSFILSEEEVEI